MSKSPSIPRHGSVELTGNINLKKKAITGGDGKASNRNSKKNLQTGPKKAGDKKKVASKMS